MILEVKIKAPPGGDRLPLRFSQSPIRIGRNQLNDIPLEDPFISEWHGTIRFDQRSVVYSDLGSTNGTLLDGKLLPKNVATELSDSSRLQIGLIELAVSRRAREPDSAPPLRPPHASGPHQTLAWGQLTPGGGLRPAGRGAQPGAAPSRDTPVGALPHEAEGNRSSAALPFAAAPSAAATLRKPAAQDILEHQRKLLEAFAEAFIGLRKGYEQFGAEVGVRTINGSTPLHRARSQRELLEYILQPHVDTATTARDLIAIFADFGIHHLAMMQGVTEGVRAMLQSLNPQSNDIDAGKRIFSGAKTKGQWKAYLDRFDQLITDDNELHSAIFGNEFARAYASVTVGDGKPAEQGDED